MTKYHSKSEMKRVEALKEANLECKHEPHRTGLNNCPAMLDQDTPNEYAICYKCGIKIKANWSPI